MYCFRATYKSATICQTIETNWGSESKSPVEKDFLLWFSFSSLRSSGAPETPETPASPLRESQRAGILQIVCYVIDDDGGESPIDK